LNQAGETEKTTLTEFTQTDLPAQFLSALEPAAAGHLFTQPSIATSQYVKPHGCSHFQIGGYFLAAQQRRIGRLGMPYLH
jgi:hypothetical protein